MSWPRLASDGYDFSELDADYYDEILFERATFSDLIPRDTPVAVVTGTDLSSGARFEFSQDTFDLLCSDLGSVRLSRAAATSSAVPVSSLREPIATTAGSVTPCCRSGFRYRGAVGGPAPRATTNTRSPGDRGRRGSGARVTFSVQMPKPTHQCD